MNSGLSKAIIVKIDDVIALVAKQKDLELIQKPKKNMYIEDVTEYTHVLLTTTEMTFICSWQHIQILFFMQLAVITASHPEALLHLHYQNITLFLIQDPEGRHPQLFIFLKPDFTKSFMKISTTGPVLDSAEKLYSLTVLEGKRQQKLQLKDELRISFEEIAHPYNLRYAGAKAFNSSEEVTDALQNVILQHSDIRTFVRHYEVDVDVDVQGIVRKTGSQTPLVRFACSMSASIDPNQPYKLSTEESRSINLLPEVLARQDTVNKRKQEWEDCKARLERANTAFQAHFGHLNKEELSKYHSQLLEKLENLQDRTMDAKHKYNRAVRELRNEKQ
ncbi:hypothetical protein CISG_06112 [Coccidioides immitis RMSCC 3703]|uniref:Uncharacterized protein n=1 Tax=Coccidioides immitis RMSCC 3703 TaxID=454286 RepID=A0A0J8QW59_COCIT|nr:hypothetical protein CISG_06112 [Coccidioides immitis RMSCC 3703]